MKKFFLLAFTVFAMFSVQSQIMVGAADNLLDSEPEPNKKEIVDLFLSKKTIFILPDNFTTRQYTSIISEVWNCTPYEIFTQSEFKNLSEEQKADKYNRNRVNYCEFLTRSFGMTNSKGNGSGYLFNFFYFRTNKFKKVRSNGNEIYDSHAVAAIFFTPSVKQRSLDKDASPSNPHLFINYSLGFIKNYFQMVNDALKKNEFLNTFIETVDKEKIQVLAKQKLFIPNSVKVHYNSLSRTEGKEHKEDELIEDYPYPYEFIDDLDLDDKILEGEDFYYLQYGQINGKKNVFVVHSKTGAVLCSLRDYGSYNIKSKDFRDLAKKIEKSK